MSAIEIVDLVVSVVAFIVTRIGRSFNGNICCGDHTKESYEEIMQRIRNAESEYIYPNEKTALPNRESGVKDD